jgi:hypothetical protein
LCEDCPRGRNPRGRDDVFLKPSWIANKELDKMGVVGLGLLTYDISQHDQQVYDHA